MHLRCLLATSVLLLAPAASLRAVPLPSTPEDFNQFQIAEKTAIPNATLAPGSYSIHVLDHLSDRLVVQVVSQGNHVETTFLAVPAPTMSNSPAGPVLYGAGPKGNAAMKGFSFPGGVAVEFVYPKADAVSIAKANGTRVMAIDPASEGRVPAAKLSHNDMQMITLWMLEPTRVGPADNGSPAIAASRYQAPPTTQTAAQPAAQTAAQTAAQPAPVDTAQGAAPAAPAPAYSSAAYSSGSSSSPNQPAPLRPSHRQRSVQVAQNDVPPPPTHTRPANVTSLPHTASDDPLLLIAGLLSLLAAGTLSLRRQAANRA